MKDSKNHGKPKKPETKETERDQEYNVLPEGLQRSSYCSNINTSSVEQKANNFMPKAIEVRLHEMRCLPGALRVCRGSKGDSPE